MVKVLVAQRTSGRFSGFWAEFEGELIASHEAEEFLIYTLYKCTTYHYDAYRVHILDERNHEAPVYELLPFSEGPHLRGSRPDYSEPYDDRQLVEKYPVFAKHLGFFRTYPVDPR